MKIYGSLLALCVWETTGFSVQGPNVFTPKVLYSSYGQDSKDVGTWESTSKVPQPAAPAASAPLSKAASSNLGQDPLPLSIWEQPSPMTVQGGALRTWSFPGDDVERLVVDMIADDRSLTTLTHEGRLMNCKVDLCQGPDNTPLKMEVYSGKGKYRPFKAIIECPGDSSSLFIRNIASVEFPVTARVGGANSDPADTDLLTVPASIYDMHDPRTVQGGAVITFPLNPAVKKAKVILKTDGRPLNAKIELVQGPNAVKTTIDLYTESGLERPFLCVMETPGNGNVIRIVNTAAVEFPMMVCVENYELATK